MKQYLMGNEIIARAALDAGAKIMFGYPITPSTEILEKWIKFCSKDKSLQYLQTEDEMAAGFAMIGSCLAGVPAFTATAGPGNVLMQDALSMAEALRIPTVTIVPQRGGISTSTVIYSQEEVILTCFGGNGEGLRIVYSTSSLQELYDYTRKAFVTAWRYRFPTFLLGDGYQSEMYGSVQIPENVKAITSLFKPILKKGVNFRNCYNLEEEVGEIINRYYQEFQKLRPALEEAEDFQTESAQTIILAHGIVAAAVKIAVKQLRQEGFSVGLFRPITLRPFPKIKMTATLKKASKIISIESALGQLARLFKDEFPNLKQSLIEINKPAIGFMPEEIYEIVKKIAKK